MILPVSKNILLQKRAIKALRFVLQRVINTKTGVIYTETELADELKVGRALINHILNERRSIDLTKIEQIEKISGIELFVVHDPEILKDFDPKPKKKVEKVVPENQLIYSMEDKLNAFDFYTELLKETIKKLETKYPQVHVETRKSIQYLSLNVFGNLIREKLKKDNLHLLFFRYIEIDRKPLIKIEYMISDEHLKKSIKEESGFTELEIFHSTDNARVTDFINGKAVLNKKRAVYKMSELSDTEIDNFAKLSLAVFQIQLGLY